MDMDYMYVLLTVAEFVLNGVNQYPDCSVIKLSLGITNYVGRLA